MKATIELEANSLINEHIVTRTVIVTRSGERKQLAQTDVQWVFIQDTDELHVSGPQQSKV